mgnify:CR=1 FL=1
MKDKIVSLKGVKKYFPAGKNLQVKAVDDVTFDIYRGETFGLVGESGCGKTTLGRTIIDIYKPTEGTIEFEGKNVADLKGKEKHNFKKDAQMIFQDPYSSLDPRMVLSEIIGEGLNVHFPKMSRKEKRDKVTDLLKTVGLNAEHGARFPHELSGGQRQRIGIARALAVQPDFIVCDEPISALDVSIQAQVVNLLERLQNEHDLTYLFISHDLSMVKHISDRIGVMYLGSMVEIAESHTLYEEPLHPYTNALISAIPVADPDADKKMRVKLEGEIPSPINPPSGCKFSSRCPKVMDICHKQKPTLLEIKPKHFVACHLYTEGLSEEEKEIE